MAEVPERVRWAVETLRVRPGDRVLEIGCGVGVAVSLLCDRLEDGTITAIDRSAKAIATAGRRNAAHVEAGRAVLEVASLDAFSDAGVFDKIFAINVNVFWVGRATVELEVIRRHLAPDGRLWLFYEPPTPENADEVAQKVAGGLQGAGFTAMVSRKGASLVGVEAAISGTS
ncbi:SAM-dependent methyltransferase [Actinomadura rudentiformis]|uniref:Class I SAM-dependent methyltransferase n=1 Tax=Actinomadura rudentiformis TaxID=359158 RepID=A0A6H9YMZ3_9ACTN|nr:class I SAM-dependent methyltransferase [Actinomadura rudentiformis]KAB2343718.1 class I SAM-dependent methyltransferase [Actinomadura rudentiformis]